MSDNVITLDQRHFGGASNGAPKSTGRMIGEKPEIRLSHPSVQVLSRPGVDVAALRSLAKNDPSKYADLCRDLTERRLEHVRKQRNGESSGDKEAEKFSFRHVSDLKALQDGLDFQINVNLPGQEGRAVITDALPLIVSGLAVAGVNEAYEGVPTIGQELVTDMDDNKKHSEFAGITSLTKTKEQVQELEEFWNLGAGEERFSITHKRNGCQVVIPQELFEENDRAGVIERLTAVGMVGAELQEEQTLEKVTDHDGSASSGSNYTLNFNGAGVALFQTDNDPLTRAPSAGTRLTNNALVDHSDIEAMRSRLAGFTNSRGKRIAFRGQLVHLVPDALWVTAWKLYNSLTVPGVFGEANFYGPGGQVMPRLISSPKLDDLSTSAHYMGFPAAIFVRKWKLRPEIATLSGTGTEAFVRTRTGLRVRLAWDMEVGARDYVGWVQSLSATTAPKDE